jgi:hypothetical protein
MGTTFKCHFSLGLPSVSPKIGIFVVPKLWTFISFSNQVCFENARAISCIPKKDLSNSVLHISIEFHLTPTFKRCVVGNQISNLTPSFSFDHNSCTLGLNEQCEGILSIYASIKILWCPRGPIWCLFSFPTKALIIHNSFTSVTRKVGVHLGVIELHPLHFPPFVRVCVHT